MLIITFVFEIITNYLCLIWLISLFTFVLPFSYFVFAVYIFGMYTFSNLLVYIPILCILLRIATCRTSKSTLSKVYFTWFRILCMFALFIELLSMSILVEDFLFAS